MSNMRARPASTARRAPSAPIKINFLDTAGSVAPGLLPTGNVRDVIDGITVTCIDNGMPLVIFKAADVGRTGYESVDQLNADTELKARIERLRIACGHAMKLGDVTGKNYPKMTLISAPRAGRQHLHPQLHPACLPRRDRRAGGGDGCDRLRARRLDHARHRSRCRVSNVKNISVEHPTGEFSVEIEVDPANPQNVTRAALLRTARLLMRGEAMVPASVWAGHQAGRSPEQPSNPVAPGKDEINDHRRSRPLHHRAEGA